MPQIIIPILIKAAIAVAVNFAVRAFIKKPKSRNETPDASQTVLRRIKNNLPREVLVGERIVGGVAAFDDSYGANRENGVRVTIFSAYECTSFEQLYMDGEPVILAGDPTTGEVAVSSHFLGRGGAQRAFFRIYLGANNAGLGAFLSSRFPSKFTANDNFEGMCVGILRCVNTDADLDKDNGKNHIPFRSFPSFRVRLKGSPVCDTRLGQTYADPTSWTYSANSALVDEQHKYGWFQQGRLIAGMGLPENIMDLTQGALNADYCDTNSFECHGVIRSGNSQDAQSVRDTYNGVLVESLAKIFTIPEGNRDTEGTLDLEAHIGAKVVRFDPFGYSTEAYNQTLTTYVEPGENYTEKELPPLTDPAFLAEDNGVSRILQISLPYVTDKDAAAKIEKADLITSRSQATCSIEGLPYHLSGYSVGNTITLVGSDISEVNGKLWSIESLVETQQGTVNLSLRAFDPDAHVFGAADMPAVTIVPPTTYAWSEYWQPRDYVAPSTITSLQNNDAAQDANINAAAGAAASGGTLTASVSQSAIAHDTPTLPGTTPSVTVSAMGGGGTFTYSWVRTAGDIFIDADSPSAATTTFTATDHGLAEFECTVSDGTSTYVVTVSVLIFEELF